MPSSVSSLPAPTAAPFPSARAAQDAHARLLATLPEKPDPTDLVRIAEFIRQAVATGVVLDSPDDRKQVQGLVDYWTASLQTEYREAAGRWSACPSTRPATTVLAEFDKGRLQAAVVRTEEWLAKLPKDQLRMAQRVILRLTRLRATEPVFDLVTAPRGALQFQGSSPEAVDELIRQLTDLGVVRVTPGTNPENDRVVLRSSALLTDWPSLARWQEDRLQFRARADRWRTDQDQADRVSLTRSVDRLDRWLTRKLSKFGRSVDKRLTPALRWLRRKSGLSNPSSELLTGDALEDARAYHDRNPVERQFVDESKDVQQLSGDRNRVLMGAFGLTTIVALIGWTIAGMSAIGWRLESIRTKTEKEVALVNLRMAGVRRSQALEQRREFERTELELAATLESVLRSPAAAQVWNDDERKAHTARVRAITDWWEELKVLRDPSQPLRPGSRVWIDTTTDGPTISSVCCVVHPIGDSSRRYVVTYCSPAARTQDRVAVYRTDATGHTRDAGKRIGFIPKLRLDTPSAAELSARQWIALIELEEGVKADNVLPLIGGELTGVVDAAEGNVTLLGSSSGKQLGRVERREGDAVRYVKRDGSGGRCSTIGDAGGPVVDETNQLIAVHQISQLEWSEGCRLAQWLKDNKLELVPSSAK